MGGGGEEPAEEGTGTQVVVGRKDLMHLSEEGRGYSEHPRCKALTQRGRTTRRRQNRAERMKG